MGGQLAVFLDRDGTINQEVGYIRDVANLKLIPGSGAAIAKLNALGVPVVVVTNQSGPARGFYPEDHVFALHDRLRQVLAEEGATVDAIHHCPHLPEGVVPEFTKVCGCRKPAPGMLKAAAAEHGYDLARSYMVGDKGVDVGAGRAAGTKTVLLRTGYGPEELAALPPDLQPDHVADDLAAAVAWILADAGLGA